jgi:hypothetical protein
VDAKATAAAHKASKPNAMVSCTDGTQSKGGRGACSSHGGVASASASAAAPAPAPPPAPAPAPPTARKTAPVAPAPAPAPPPPTDRVRPAAPPVATGSNATGGTGKPENNDPAGATAKCKDGTYSHSAHRTGTCSRHGGVSQWLVS